MPELDGPGLYRELQNRHPGFCQRIIFLTGDTLNLETQGFLEQTAAPTLNKPFVWEEVRRIVQQALHPCKESSK
jgi:CheY-like chemotaxis protein